MRNETVNGIIIRLVIGGQSGVQVRLVSRLVINISFSFYSEKNSIYLTLTLFKNVPYMIISRPEIKSHTHSSSNGQSKHFRYILHSIIIAMSMCLPHTFYSFCHSSFFIFDLQTISTSSTASLQHRVLIYIIIIMAKTNKGWEIRWERKTKLCFYIWWCIKVFSELAERQFDLYD